MARLLQREKHRKKVVAQLKGNVCNKFVERIFGRKNFSNKWIVGGNPVRISNICDHAQNDQHTHAMLLQKKQHAESARLGLSSYAPMAKAFNTVSDEERVKLLLKFDIAHIVATENLPLIMYPTISKLEAHHGVHLSTSYITSNAGKEIIHYITESRRQELMTKLANAKFFPCY